MQFSSAITPQGLHQIEFFCRDFGNSLQGQHNIENYPFAKRGFLIEDGRGSRL